MKTIQELEERVQSANNTIPSWWCPQMNSRCKNSCYCYVPAKVLIKSDSTPYIRGAYCSHVLHQEELPVCARIE